MMAIVDMIGKEQAIADKICVVDVSQNRLRFMDYFAALVPRLPNVVCLHMRHNQVGSILFALLADMDLILENFSWNSWSNWRNFRVGTC